MAEPIVRQASPLADLARLIVAHHRPMAYGNLVVCKGCGAIWKCRPHLTGEKVLRAAGLDLAEYDGCDADLSG